MPAAVTKGKVEDPALTNMPFVEDRDFGFVPMLVPELGAAAAETGEEQDSDVARPTRQVKHVAARHIDFERRDRRMGGEASAEQFHEAGIFVGTFDLAVGGEAQQRIGTAA